ncbi:MAG: chromosomal replication initiator protein DnaA [Planctomycetes bacterium]|nr:chromosomal replication initiator protein DnaA [Planctomycetota bacterium]
MQAFEALVLREVRARIRQEQFDSWFSGMRLVSLAPEEIEFSVPTGFVRNWLTRNFLGAIQEAVLAAGKVLRRIRLTVQAGPEAGPARRDDPDDTRRNAVEAAVGGPAGPIDPTPGSSAAPEPEGESSDPILNQNYSFEQFVIGPCNRLSHAAALAVAQNPGRAYNPLFLHGHVGLGKTHLLQAICHTALGLRRPRRLRVVYTSCEDFTNRFIQAVQDGTLDRFRRSYRTADVLVVDDIQFLSGKEKTQEEFFHTFNDLYNWQKQIVISSDRGPERIEAFQERLLSRFKWGMVAEMERPCFETRMAIVKRKARMRSVELSDDVAWYIAERIDTNIRELEGAVIKVIGIAAVTEREVSQEVAEEALRGTAQVRSSHVTLQEVMSLITEEFSISPRDLTGKKRTQAVSLPRQIGMFLAREYTEHSLEEIGRFFGNRDHTTVIYAVSKVRTRAGEDRMFQDLLTTLRTRLQGNGFGRSH